MINQTVQVPPDEVQVFWLVNRIAPGVPLTPPSPPSTKIARLPRMVLFEPVQRNPVAQVGLIRTTKSPGGMVSMKLCAEEHVRKSFSVNPRPSGGWHVQAHWSYVIWGRSTFGGGPEGEFGVFVPSIFELFETEMLVPALAFP